MRMNWKLLSDEHVREHVDELLVDSRERLADLVRLRDRIRKLEAVDGVPPNGVSAELAAIAHTVRDELEHAIDSSKLELSQLVNAVDLYQRSQRAEVPRGDVVG